MRRKPPKEFWDKMYKEVKAGNPEYSDEVVSKIVGDMWFNKLKKATKARYNEMRRKREARVKALGG